MDKKEQIKLIKARHSVRQYTETPLEEAVIKELEKEIAACNDEGGLLKIAVLEPAVDFQKLEDVMVITASREAPPEPLKTPMQTPGTETDPAAQAAEQAAAANGDADSSSDSSSSSSSDGSADSGEGSAQ